MTVQGRVLKPGAESLNQIGLSVPAISWLFTRGKATKGRLFMLGVGLGGAPFAADFGYVADSSERVLAGVGAS